MISKNSIYICSVFRYKRSLLLTHHHPKFQSLFSLSSLLISYFEWRQRHKVLLRLRRWWCLRSFSFMWRTGTYFMMTVFNKSFSRQIRCDDVQHYVTELMEYLKAELENNLDESDSPIIFTVSLDVTYSTQWEKFQNDDKSDPEEDDETYTLRSGNLFVEDRDHLIQKIVQAHIKLYDANEVYDCTERCLQAKSIKNVSCKVLMYGRWSLSTSIRIIALSTLHFPQWHFVHMDFKLIQLENHVSAHTHTHTQQERDHNHLSSFISNPRNLLNLAYIRILLHWNFMFSSRHLHHSSASLFSSPSLPTHHTWIRIWFIHFGPGTIAASTTHPIMNFANFYSSFAMSMILRKAVNSHSAVPHYFSLLRR